MVNLCINSRTGLVQLNEAVDAGLQMKEVWIQPGASSPEIEAFCEQQDLPVFHGCVMVELGLH